jgi:dTDP-4-dehydrorhamnose reductase
VYGTTKEAGESALRQVLPSHFIIRTSWLYGKYGKNFVYTMLRLFKEKESIGVVADRHGTPTWTMDLAEFIFTVIKKGPQLGGGACGTYHFSGEGETTWYDFAREIYALGREHGIVQSECEINPLTTEQYPTTSKRPQYSVLDKTKAKETFGITVPHWKESIEKFVTEIKR